MPIPFIPAPYEEEQLRVGQYDYRQWRIEKEQADQVPPVQNVRFTHNPNWRNDDFFSLQAIRDGSHSNVVVWLFWQTIRWLFALSSMAIVGVAFTAVGWFIVLLLFFGWTYSRVSESVTIAYWRFIWAGRQRRR